MFHSASEPGLRRPSSRAGSRVESDDGTSRVGERARRFEIAHQAKRTEQDVALLENRINLLRAEEQKAQKKIQEANKQARNILDLRRRNDERRLNADDGQGERELELQQMREQNAKSNARHKRTLVRNGMNLLNQKRDAHRIVMDQRQGIEEQIRHDREDDYLRAAYQRDRVRSAELALAHRRQRALENKRLEGSRAYEASILAQEQSLREKEEAMQRMEQEEKELIQRLQKTQQRQRAAFAQLEDIQRQPYESSRSSSRVEALPARSSARSLSKPPTVDRHDALTAVPERALHLHPTQMKEAHSLPALPDRGFQLKEAKVYGGMAYGTPAKLSSQAEDTDPISDAASAKVSTRNMAAEQNPQTYTTVDGLTIEVTPEEEDIDLFALLGAE